MKQRNFLTNIFSVLLIVSLVAFLLVTFDIIKGGFGSAITYISLPLAIISVACIDIVFPILDNKKRLMDDKVLRILTIVKSVVFIAAFVVMGLFVFRKGITNEVTAVVVFIVLYFAQFFINIDPKQEKVSKEELEEEELEEEDEES